MLISKSVLLNAHQLFIDWLIDWIFGRFLFSLSLKKFLKMFYSWERERECTSGEGAERERDTESEAGSRLWAVSTESDAGLELTSHEIMTWAEVGCPTDWATQAPLSFLSLVILRETETTQVGEGQRERERERIPSKLCAVSTELQIHKPVRLWPELKSRVRCLTNSRHPGAPVVLF